MRAGLIPALKKRSSDQPGGITPGAGGSPWEIHLIVPSAHPLEALAASLTRDSESVSATAALLDDMARDPRSLGLFLLKRQAAQVGGFSSPGW